MNDPIRVLCVFSTLDRGGAESMCMELYRHIDRNIIQFDFVKHTSNVGAFEEEILSKGGRIYEAPRFSISNIIKYRTWWKQHFDSHPEHLIVHGHYFTISAVYFQIAKRKNRITIGHIHASKVNNFWKALLAKTISHYTDYPLACSQMAGEWVYGRRPFTVLNNAIDSIKFRSNRVTAERIRDEFSLGNNLIIGNVGRFCIPKNPYGILEIFRRVHDRRPDSKLLWIGDGPMRVELQNKVAEYKIMDSVIFTGVRDDVEELLQAVDVFVFPSFYEGLGVAAVEAQAAGVETYCSSSVPHEAAVTELCHFFSLTDLDAWVNSILDIQSNYIHPDMTNQIIKAGYDINETSKWLEDFYFELMK